jgi:hypothetical protein
MYIVRDYMTNETVAITTRKVDADAMVRTDRERKLIVEKG